MRVIRIELFFERSAFRWMTFDYAPTSEAAQAERQHDAYQPNISIAWLQLDYDEPTGAAWTPVADVDLRGFIRRALKGFDNPAMRRASVGDDLLSAVLGAEIVIERSPPTTVTLKDLVAGGGKAATGISLGYAAAQGHSPEFLMITVPVGIIIMRTAVSISKGLEGILPKLIKEVLSPKRLLK